MMYFLKLTFERTVILLMTAAFLAGLLLREFVMFPCYYLNGDMELIAIWVGKRKAVWRMGKDILYYMFREDRPKTEVLQEIVDRHCGKPGKTGGNGMS